MYDGAVELADGVDPADEVFSPKEKPVYLNRVGSTGNTKAWISEVSVGNKRTNIISRVLECNQETTAEVLSQLWDALYEDQVFFAPKEGLRAIANSAISVELNDGTLFKCTKCRRLTQWSLPNRKCPTKNCVEGRLEIVTIDKNNHYRNLFETLEIAGLNSKEHTAQWTAEEAEIVQEEFISGKVNVLSCSTTFEMGVDIGSIVAVLCRNVPPSPANYVQRAGRAGRRQGDKALIVTFARRRSHDIQYVSNPLMLIKGAIPVPSLSLENVDLVRRHIFAIALSEYLRQSGFVGTRSDDFFEARDGSPSESRKFITWLKTNPAELLKQIQNLGLPESVTNRLGVSNWEWVRVLDEANDDGRGAWLAGIEKLYEEDISGITATIDSISGSKETSTQAARKSRLLKMWNPLRTVESFQNTDSLLMWPRLFQVLHRHNNQTKLNCPETYLWQLRSMGQVVKLWLVATSLLVKAFVDLQTQHLDR
jgi:hypothetical protein